MRNDYAARSKIEVPPAKELSYFDVEVSWGGRWVSLNDHVNYQVSADTRENTTVSWRRIQTTSAVLEGTYTVHAVKETVNEQVNVLVFAPDQFDLAINVAKLEELFSQHSYRIRFTYDDYLEYWDCQMADYSLIRSQVYTHSTMAGLQAQVPRFPTVVREKRI